MRTRFAIFIIGLLILAAAAPGVGAAKSYRAERFDVDIVVQDDGALLVTETVVFRFSGDPFTYVYRDLPTSYTDSITIVSAGMDGQTLPPGEDAGQVEIDGGDTINVRWHFAPTSDTAHTFVLVYRALGVIRMNPEADVLAWQALPDDYEYTIASSTVTVSYPKAIQRVAVPRVTVGEASVETGDGQVRFVAQNLEPDSHLIVELGFAPGSLVTQPPQWQAVEIESNRLAQPLALASGALTLLGVGAIIAYVRRFRRPSASPVEADMRPTAPPGSLPPALGGAIGHAGGFAPGWDQALATLFDLSSRGMVQIEESPEKKWHRRHDFVFRLQSMPSDLRPFEQAALDLVFSTGADRQTSVKLSALQSWISSRLKAFKETLKQDAANRGWFDPGREQIRRGLFIASGLLFGVLLAFACLVVTAANPIWAFMLPLIALGLVDLALLIAGSVVSPLSETGAAERRQWEAFGKYLRRITEDKEPVNLAGAFQTLLPWATAFGLLKDWVDFFQKKGDLTVPAWFAPLANTADGSEIAIFAAMTHSASSAGASAGGAGGGAAGGGGSGAG